KLRSIEKELATKPTKDTKPFVIPLPLVADSVLTSTQSVNGDESFDAPDRNLSLRVKFQPIVAGDGVPDCLGDGNGHGLRFPAQAGSKIDCAADRGIIEVLGSSDVAYYGTAGVNANAESAHLLRAQRIVNPRTFQNLQSAQTTLKDHLR